jgi:hypothetical protein
VTKSCWNWPYWILRIKHLKSATNTTSVWWFDISSVSYPGMTICDESVSYPGRVIICHNYKPSAFGSSAITCNMAMDQYLLIPFLVGWTSINPSYFDVNYRGTRFWPIPICFFWGETLAVKKKPAESGLWPRPRLKANVIVAAQLVLGSVMMLPYMRFYVFLTQTNGKPKMDWKLKVVWCGLFQVKF